MADQRHRFGAAIGHVVVRVCAPAHRLRGCRLGGTGARRSPILSTRCSPPRSVSPRGARGTAATSTRARALAARRRGPVPGRGTGRVAYPGRRARRRGPLRGRSADRAGALRREMARARRDDDPIRLVWTLFYVAICQAALRTRRRVLPPREEAVQVADGTANPTARSMARYALGLVLKKSDPDRALALFDEAAELAASVQNFWWHGIALMEAAATRAVHGDPASAAREFHRRARPLGPGRGLEPAVAQPALRDAVADSARRRGRARRTAPCTAPRGQAVTVERRRARIARRQDGRPVERCRRRGRARIGLGSV